MNKEVYKAPKKGSSLISMVCSNCLTPILPLKFSNIINAFYYPNSPTIPRYSVTAVFNPDEHKDFLKNIQTIEKNEKVETVIKNDSSKKDGVATFTGDLLIKFQTKEKIPVFVVGENGSLDDAVETKITHELERGDMIQVSYDVIRYTKRMAPVNAQNGISFKANRVYYFPHLSKKDS